MAATVQGFLQALVILTVCCLTTGLRQQTFQLSLKGLQKIDVNFNNFKGMLRTIGMILPLEDNSHNVSFNCLNDTEKVLVDLRNLEPYAFKFIDAEAKIPYGVLQGQVFWVGDYHECLNITSSYNRYTDHTFKGRYFTARTSKLTLGFCMPDSCDRQDVKALLSNISDVFTNVYPADGKSPDTSDIVGIVICGMIVLIVTIGTFVDYYTSRTMGNKDKEDTVVNGYVKFENEVSTGSSGILADTSLMEEHPPSPTMAVKVLTAFSFFTNTKKLMSTKTAKGPLACLNGLRVISMFWVIQGHTYGFVELGLKDVLYASTLLSGRFSFQAILNGTYSVDTFFFLSGFLVAFLALKELSDKGRINWPYYFLHRYWRLTPIYAICIMFFTTVYTLMISGPFQWIALDPEGPLYNATQDCRVHWWSNLLYVNNFYPHYGGETNCFGWAWYLANDMQFYVFISPLVIILLHKFKFVGIAYSLFLIGGSIASRAVTADYYGMNYDMAMTKHQNDPWAKGGPLYVKPYARWSVYVVGMLTGYFLQRRRCILRLNKALVLLGWCIATAIGMAVIYGLFYYHSHPGSIMPRGPTLFYVSCARTAWALALAWVVVACATGNGGWVTTILSWKFWAPLGRLTYAAYLVHPMILFGYYLNNVAPLQYTDLTMIYIFIANIVLSYATAYIVSMAVEAPMMQLEKILLGKA